MFDSSPELSLAWCVGLTAAAFAAAGWFAARRMTASRSQAAVDAFVLGYAVQYAAVGLPGTVGLLRPAVVAGVALLLWAGLAVAAYTAPRPSPKPPRLPRVPLGILGFAAAFVAAYAQFRSPLPVVANDALTYHFPAAVQWLQTGRIGLFPTWFFNPANAYSPLAGSTFTLWLLMPFSSDVLARFVAVPATLGVGAAVFALARQLRAPAVAAALCAAAAMLCRPLLSAATMGKDDGFVALFFAAAVLALHPARAAERWGGVRLGVAVGLLLATKYTALLAVPLLAVAIDGPWRAGWRGRRWLLAFATVALLAGPWYLRNAILTGNPLFPVRAAGLHGLFTTARSETFGGMGSALGVVLGGSYGLPVVMAAVVVAGWVWATIAAGRNGLRDPVRRACGVGPPLGLLLFYAASPYPESRFLYPALVLLFAAAAAGATALPTVARVAGPTVLLAAALATSTPSGAAVATVQFAAVAAVAVAAGWGMDRAARRWTVLPRLGLLAGLPALLVVGLVFVYWGAYCDNYRDSVYGSIRLWDQPGYYRPEMPTWTFVHDHVPPDATLAYTGTHYVYPLQGLGLRRRVVYVPTRRGVRTIADLPYLGDRLSGERVVPAARAATVADPDEAGWLANLTESGAGYLVAFTNQGDVPERHWADRHPERFEPVYTDAMARVYRVRR